MGVPEVAPLVGQWGGPMEVPLAAQMGHRLEALEEGPKEGLSVLMVGPKVQVDQMVPAMEGCFRFLPWHQMPHRAWSLVRLPLLVLVLLLPRFSLLPWSSLTMPYLAA